MQRSSADRFSSSVNVPGASDRLSPDRRSAGMGRRNGRSCYRAAVAVNVLASARNGPIRDPGPIVARWLGRIDYREAHALQRRLAGERADDAIGDQLLLLEHPPVLTLGRNAAPSHVRATPAELRARGIEVIEV